MKKIFITLVVSMVLGCTAFGYDVIEMVTFDSVRELVEWVQSCDAQQYGGEFGKFIEDAQASGTVFTAVSEDDFEWGWMLPQQEIICNYFLFGEEKLQLDYILADRELVAEHETTGDYFRARYPKADIKDTRVEVDIDGVRRDTEAAIMLSRMIRFASSGQVQAF